MGRQEVAVSGPGISGASGGRTSNTSKDQDYIGTCSTKKATPMEHREEFMSGEPVSKTLLGPQRTSY